MSQTQQLQRPQQTPQQTTQQTPQQTTQQLQRPQQTTQQTTQQTPQQHKQQNTQQQQTPQQTPQQTTQRTTQQKETDQSSSAIKIAKNVMESGLQGLSIALLAGADLARSGANALSLPQKGMKGKASPTITNTFDNLKTTDQTSNDISLDDWTLERD